MYQNTAEIRRADLEGPLMQEAPHGYITPKVFPVFTMDHQQGTLPEIVRTDDQVLDVSRAPKTDHKRIQGEVGRITIATSEQAIEEPFDVTDSDILGPDRAEMAVAMRTRNVLCRATDAALASALFSTATFGSGYNTAAASNWDHATTANAIKDVELAKEQVYKRIGMEPNALLISRGLQTKLSASPAMQARANIIGGYLGDRSAYAGLVPAEVLSQIFGLEVIIAGGVHNSAQKGVTPVRAYLWDVTYALVFAKAQGDDLGTPQLGRTFVWNAGQQVDEEAGYVDEMAGLIIETYRQPTIAADIVRAKNHLVQRLLLKDAGHLITGC
jgi:hypothetical protein